jgi:hypothetical protein
MKTGTLTEDVTNTVLDHPFTLGKAGDKVYIHEEQTTTQALEVSTEANPSMTFWVRLDQLEIHQ